MCFDSNFSSLHGFVICEWCSTSMELIKCCNDNNYATLFVLGIKGLKDIRPICYRDLSEKSGAPRSQLCVTAANIQLSER